MKKQKQYFTNYKKDKLDVEHINKKVKNLIEKTLPDSVLGMIATAKETSQGVLFYDRYLLIPHEQHRYDIYDKHTGNTVYKSISLFNSALNIIFNLNKTIGTACPKYVMIYELDQEYYRCREDIHFFSEKTKTNKNEFYSHVLLEKRHRLLEIKRRLSKIY
jgi:hypothetical protein